MAGSYPRRPEIQRRRSLHFIRASEEYTLSEYEHLFGNGIPHIVMVTQGGQTGDMEFIKGQILSLQAISRQERVVGKAVKRNYNEFYGIPSGVYQNFHVVNREGKATGNDSCLFDLLRKKKLPFRVQFQRGSVLKYGNKTISTNSVPQLDLMYMYDETHVLANFIIGDELMEDILYIPFHDSSLRVAMVIGIDGLAGNVFRSFKEKTDHECMAYEYDLEYGKIDVALYDAKALQGKKITRCSQPLKYTTFGELFDRPEEENQEGAAESSLVAPPDEEEPSVYECPLDENEDGDGGYEELKDISRRQSTGPKSLQTSPAMLAVYKDELMAKIRERPPPPLPKPKPKPASQTGDSGVKSAREVYNIPKGTKLYVNDIPRGQVAPFMKTPETNVDTISGESTDTTAKTPSSQVKEKHISTTTKQEEKPATDNEPSPYNISPMDVSKLSIDQVCNYLKILRLDKYSETFREEMIDGQILQELDTTVLVRDFGFKSIEAIRLMKFVKQAHVPT